MLVEVKTQCPVCGGVLQRPGARLRSRKVCSRECASISHRGNSEAKFNLQAFQNWSDDMAYALGLFFSDGSLIAHGDSWRIRFCNTDLPLVQWWHSYLRNPGKVTLIQPHKTPIRITSDKGYLPKKVKYQSQTSSKTLGDQLFNWGAIPRKSYSPIRVPDVPSVFQGSFLRGFFDGDGCICISKQRLWVTLTCNSGIFRQGLLSLLSLNGIQAKESGIAVRMSGSSAEKFCLLLYGSPGFALGYKREKWGIWLDHRKAWGGLICGGYHSRGFRSQDWHHLVGTLPDAQIASLVGRDKSQVCRIRNRLGIPVCKQEASA